jgi:hypothetical protein
VPLFRIASPAIEVHSNRNFAQLWAPCGRVLQFAKRCEVYQAGSLATHKDAMLNFLEARGLVR